MECPICKKDNNTKDLFCNHCRYPINVKKIDEYSDADLSYHLTCFNEILSSDSVPLTENVELNQIYDEYIHLDWLRPESAIIRFLRAKIMLDIRDKYLNYPMLDLGCGDGIFTSILFGARVNKKYDAYEEVDFSKSDVYNIYKKFPNDYLVQKSKRIGIGVDIKDSMVKKARNLKCYDSVHTGDIRNIPISTSSVKSVYCSMVDDIKLEDLETVFNDVSRVLCDNGHFVFTTPTEYFTDYLYYKNKAATLGNKNESELCMLLDRGRSEWKSRPLDFWKVLLENTPFEIVGFHPYGNKKTLNFWDTGFRPLFKTFMDMRKNLKANGLFFEMKIVWVTMLKETIKKYVKSENIENGAFSIIILKKMEK
jgi:SAM-dependent methyltransferase